MLRTLRLVKEPQIPLSLTNNGAMWAHITNMVESPILTIDMQGMFSMFNRYAYSPFAAPGQNVPGYNDPSPALTWASYDPAAFSGMTVDPNACALRGYVTRGFSLVNDSEQQTSVAGQSWQPQWWYKNALDDDKWYLGAGISYATGGKNDTYETSQGQTERFDSVPSWNDLWASRCSGTITPSNLAGDQLDMRNVRYFGIQAPCRPIKYAYTKSSKEVLGKDRLKKFYQDSKRFHTLTPLNEQGKVQVTCSEICRSNGMHLSPFDHVPSLPDMLQQAASSLAFYGTKSDQTGTTLDPTLVRSMAPIAQSPGVPVPSQPLGRDWALDHYEDQSPPFMLVGADRGGSTTTNLIKQTWRFTHKYFHKHPYSMLACPDILQELPYVEARILILKAPSYFDTDAQSIMQEYYDDEESYNTRTMDVAQFHENFMNWSGFKTPEGVTHGALFDNRDLNLPVNTDVWGVLADRRVKIPYGQSVDTFIAVNHQYKHETEFYGTVLDAGVNGSFCYRHMKQNRIFPVVMIRFPKNLKTVFEKLFFKQSSQLTADFPQPANPPTGAAVGPPDGYHKDIFTYPLAVVNPQLVTAGSVAGVSEPGRLQYNEAQNTQDVRYSARIHRNLSSKVDPYFLWGTQNATGGSQPLVADALVGTSTPGVRSTFDLLIAQKTQKESRTEKTLPTDIMMGLHTSQRVSYMVNYM